MHRISGESVVFMHIIMWWQCNLETLYPSPIWRSRLRAPFHALHMRLVISTISTAPIIYFDTSVDAHLHYSISSARETHKNALNVLFRSNPTLISWLLLQRSAFTPSPDAPRQFNTNAIFWVDFVEFSIYIFLSVNCSHISMHHSSSGYFRFIVDQLILER